MNYQQQYRPTGFSVLPPVVKNLLIINVLAFLAQNTFENVLGINMVANFGLFHFSSPFYRIYQQITYMFLHANFTHLFFNMFALWMFGNALENYWGPKRFLIYYLVTGIGAGLIQQLVVTYSIANAAPDAVEFIRNIPTIGASGSVYGLLLGFGMIFPNALIYLYFMLPIKAKWFVIIYGAIELYMGFNSHDNVAHFAHLGGMIFGFFLIKYWNAQMRNRNRWN